MATKVKRLDPLVSCKIAAGEVIERPASVVKELVENSLDAGATSVSIEIEGGGLELIRVVDDGCGMDREDAVLALERFATSKLSSADDLFNIATLGFRGEALPSIAACSHMTIATRSRGSQSGTVVNVSGGEVQSVEEKGLPYGTSVVVRDLFFNAPARLKFMKSKGHERDAVVDVVTRLALAWPNVRFTLSSGRRPLLSTGGRGLRNAFADIFGPELSQDMLEVEHEDASDGCSSMRIEGLAARPGKYRKSRDIQFFSVNNRPIVNSSLGYALDRAYAATIPPGSHALAVLNVKMNPGEVDVNVHPTKAQVKFRDEKRVLSALNSALNKSFAGLGFSVTFPKERLGMQKEIEHRSAAPAASSRLEMGSAPSFLVREPYLRELDSSTAFSANATGEELAMGESLERPYEYLGPLGDTYLLAKTKNSLLVIDKHALAESLAYRELLERKSGRQELLMQELVRLDPVEARLFEEHLEQVESVGFGARLVGSQTALVTSVPVILGKPIPPTAIREVLRRIEEEGAGFDPGRMEESAAIALAACHASVRSGESLSREEAEDLLDRLFARKEALLCPHGRPTTKEITYEDLDRFFGRR